MNNPSNVYTWGHGEYDELLQDGKQDVAQPTAIQAYDVKFDLSTFRICGNMSVLWDHDGILYTFGHGLNGQLGHGDHKNVPKPKKIAALSKEKISAVAGGEGYHTIFLSFTGHVWGCGTNAYLQACGSDKNYGSDVLLPTIVVLPELTSQIGAGFRFSGCVNQARNRIVMW